MLKTSKDHAVIKETVLKESLMAWRSAHDTTFSDQKEMQTKQLSQSKFICIGKRLSYPSFGNRIMDNIITSGIFLYYPNCPELAQKLFL